MASVFSSNFEMILAFLPLEVELFLMFASDDDRA